MRRWLPLFSSHGEGAFYKWLGFLGAPNCWCGNPPVGCLSSCKDSSTCRVHQWCTYVCVKSCLNCMSSCIVCWVFGLTYNRNGANILCSFSYWTPRGWDQEHPPILSTPAMAVSSDHILETTRCETTMLLSDEGCFCSTTWNFLWRMGRMSTSALQL